MRFILAAITAAFLALSAGAADRLSTVLNGQDITGLKAGLVLRAGLVRGSALRLVPAVSSAVSIEADVTSLDPNVGAELLQIIPGHGPQMDTPSGMLALYNVLHSVSTMTGLTYYSVTHRKEMPLFLQSSVIRSPDQPGLPPPDPVFSQVLPEHNLFTMQEDTSFGRNTYSEHVAALPDHLYLKTENLTAITYLLVPLITPHNLVSHVVLVPVGKDVLFYGVSCLRSGLPLGDLNVRTLSMQNRLVALAGWLGERMKTVTAGGASAAGG